MECENATNALNPQKDTKFDTAVCKIRLEKERTPSADLVHASISAEGVRSFSSRILQTAVSNLVSFCGLRAFVAFSHFTRAFQVNAPPWECDTAPIRTRSWAWSSHTASAVHFEC